MRFAVVVLAGLLLSCGSWPPGGGGPPTEPTPPPPDENPIPSESEQCHLTGASFSCYDNPPDGESFEMWLPNWGYVCPPIDGVTTRVGVPENCPAIPELPQPQCDSFTDRGGTVRVLDDVCNCYLQEEWIECPVEPSPGPGVCRDVEATLVPSQGCSQTFRANVKAATLTLGDLTGNHPQENLKTLAATLIEQNEGMCAFGGIEAVFILRNDGRWEENHAVFFGDGGWTNNGFGVYKGCHEDTDPTEPPEPPDPGPVVCADPNPRGRPARFNMKRVGNLNKIETNYQISERAYCLETCSPIEPDVCFERDNCPVRFEGDPERVPCERDPDVIGVQKWWCDGTPIEPSNETGSQAICSGQAKTCTEDGDTCGEIDARP